VDDFCLVTINKAKAKELVGRIKQCYKVKELGPPSQLLGLEIGRTSTGGVTVAQPGYIQGVLEQFGLQDAHSKATPLPTSAVDDLDARAAEDEPTLDKEGRLAYQTLLGCLLWVARCTRPDIAFAVGFLGRFSARPTPRVMGLAKHVLLYLKGTATTGLVYPASQPTNGSFNVCAFSDSDHAGDLVKRRSTNGYMLLFNGTPVAWTSRLQRSVSCSSTEAEFVGLFETTREVVWLRRLLDTMGQGIEGPTRVYTDSQAVLAIVGKGSGRTKRSKYFDVKFHYVVEQMEEEAITTSYISTGSNVADSLTKPLPGPTVLRINKETNVLAL